MNICNEMMKVLEENPTLFDKDKVTFTCYRKKDNDCDWEHVVITFSSKEELQKYFQSLSDYAIWRPCLEVGELPSDFKPLAISEELIKLAYYRERGMVKNMHKQLSNLNLDCAGE